MIELSKCPNCASEDRVTIAGKDFCMHCGTASEDNAMIAASGSQATPDAGNPTASAVAKFNNSNIDPQLTTQAQVVPQVVDPATPPAQPVVTPTAMPEASIAQQVNSAVASAATQQVLPDPNAMPNQNIPVNSVTQPIQAPTAINQNTAPMQMPSTPIASPAVTNSQVNPNPQNEAIVLADNKIAELTSAQNTPVNSPDTVISTLPQEKNPGNLAGALAYTSSQNNATATPALVPQYPSVQAGPATPMDGVSTNTNTVSKTMPGAGSSMTLDKAEPGVFSDEELHALSNTTVDSPIAPATSTMQDLTAAPPTTTPAPVNPLPITQPNVATQGVPTPLVADQTNQQQASAVMPQTSTSEVTDATAKQSGSKKVLKPLGVVASIALLFVAGYYMWRVNYPSLSFKIASSKAGINATLPGYIPEGYGVKGNIQANPGSVSYSLVNQSNKKIAISQAKSDWDSQALAENYVSPKAENYLAIQAQGLTIYMMGSNQASWVNKGTWYRIESPDQPLTQEQVVKLATSL
jgi:hypothetical protein